MGPRTEKIVIVFEATNDDLHQAYVGATALSLMAVERRHREECPPALAGWRPEHHVSYRIVASGLSIPESMAFLHGYAKTSERLGWSVVADGWQ